MRKIIMALLVVLSIGRGWEWYIQQASAKTLPEESRFLSEDDIFHHPIRTAVKFGIDIDN